MRLLFIILFAAAAVVSEATSIIFPSFTTPIVKNGTVIILSVDRKRLLAFDLAGKPKWQRALPDKSSLAQRKDGTLWLLSGATIATVDCASGMLRDQTAVLGIDWLRYDERSNVLLGATKGKAFTDQTGLTVLDAASRKSLCFVSQGETLTYSDADILVVAASERKIVDRGYTFARVWLECYRRADGSPLWTVEFHQRPDPWHDSARVGTWLVFEDGNEWLLIDVQSGKAERKPVDKPVKSLGPFGLREKDGHLVFTLSQLNSKDFNRSSQSIVVATVPDLQTISQTAVEVIEAGPTEDAGDYLITDSLYRTACFRRDGSKVWEHFQMHRTSAIEGLIYFTDYKDETARIGKIEVATGKESILYSETAKIE